MLHFTDEQRMIQETIGKLAKDEIAPLAIEADKNGHSSPEIIKLLEKHGLLKMALPEKYTGIDSNFTTNAIVLEELSRVDASTAMILFPVIAVIQIIKQWGDEEQKKRFFGQMSSGNKINAFALTEPNYGSESASIQTKAFLDGDHFLINGTKIFVSNGELADFTIVFVRTGEGERHKGL